MQAGLEIENSKLATREKIDTKVNKQIQPDYFERIDDRLLIFTDLNAGKNRYKYAWLFNAKLYEVDTVYNKHCFYILRNITLFWEMLFLIRLSL